MLELKRSSVLHVGVGLERELGGGWSGAVVFLYYRETTK